MRASTSSMTVATTIVLITLTAQGAEKPIGDETEGVMIAGLMFPTKVKPASFDELVTLPTLRKGDVELRDRLIAGILKWVTVRDHKGRKVVVWNECGKRVKDVQNNALEWANHLIRAANTSAEIFGWRINLWGVLGTIANESSFDRCAIGRHTREWAYANKLLKARRYTWISHSEKDILRLVKHPRWKRTWKWVDAGALQVLWKRIYRGPLENMLTLDVGLDIGIQEMQRRADHCQYYVSARERKRMTRLCRRAWRLWPGKGVEDRRATEYDTKVTKFARRMGASRAEI